MPFPTQSLEQECLERLNLSCLNLNLSNLLRSGKADECLRRRWMGGRSHCCCPLALPDNYLTGEANQPADDLSNGWTLNPDIRHSDTLTCKGTKAFIFSIGRFC